MYDGKLIINLGKNIGPFYFGMTNIEYDKIHEAYLEKFKQFYGISVHFDEDNQLDLIGIIPEVAKGFFEMTFLDIDLLNTSPEIILDRLLNKTAQKIASDKSIIEFPNWNMSITNPQFLKKEDGYTFSINFYKPLIKRKIVLTHIPQQSIGDFRFGMFKEEVEDIFNEYKKKYGNKIKHMFDFEYSYDNRLFVVHLMRETMSVHFHLNLWEIDILYTTANDTIKSLTEQGFVFEKNADAEVGTCFEFSKQGVSFWRRSVLKESDLEEQWFLDMIPENQEYEKRFLYFETIKFYTDDAFPETEKMQVKKESSQPKNQRRRNVEETMEHVKKMDPTLTDEIIRKMINKYG